MDMWNKWLLRMPALDVLVLTTEPKVKGSFPAALIEALQPSAAQQHGTVELAMMEWARNIRLKRVVFFEAPPHSWLCRDSAFYVGTARFGRDTFGAYHFPRLFLHKCFRRRLEEARGRACGHGNCVSHPVVLSILSPLTS